MVYIPKDWLIDQHNEKKVREIFERYFYTDINVSTEQAIDELHKIGETSIAAKIKNGSININ